MERTEYVARLVRSTAGRNHCGHASNAGHSSATGDLVGYLLAGKTLDNEGDAAAYAVLCQHGSEGLFGSGAGLVAKAVILP